MKIGLIVLLLGMSLMGFSQHQHYHESFEIGAASTLSYQLSEKSFAPGYHFHAIYLFNEKLGAGTGYEGIAGDAYHQTITVFAKYFLSDMISVNIGPGLTLPNKEHNEFSVSGHIELVSSFDLWKIHIGPMLGYGFNSEESHLSLGLHMGWHF